MAALMSAGDATGGDCLAQSSQGAETLTNPEPGFFILGSKPYGRRTDFLMRVGWEQVDEVFELLGLEPALTDFRTAQSAWVGGPAAALVDVANRRAQSPNDRSLLDHALRASYILLLDVVAAKLFVNFILRPLPQFHSDQEVVLKTPLCFLEPFAKLNTTLVEFRNRKLWEYRHLLSERLKIIPEQQKIISAVVDVLQTFCCVQNRMDDCK
jgi:hypothetical protein